MKFEFNNDVPIYIQLVEGFKVWIISGKLKPGERLPSVRDLALQIKVNPNTVQKALVELEELKLIYTQRTNGKFVTDDQISLNKYKMVHAKQLVKTYLEEMAKIGFAKKEAIDYLNKMEGDK